MATLEQLSAALVKADAAGNVEDAKAFASEIRRLRAPQKTGVEAIPGNEKSFAQPEAPLTTADKIRGAIETPFAVGANLVAGPVTYLAGALGPETQRKVAENIQYQPRTQMARNALEAIASASEASKLPPFMPTMGVSTAASQAARPVANALVREGELVKSAVDIPLQQRAARINQENIAQSVKNAPQIEAAQKAAELGIVLNPAASNPTKMNKIKGVVVGNKAIDTKAAALNDARWGELAKDEMGLPADTVLDKKAFETARDNISGPYRVIEQMPALAPTQEVDAALNKLRQSEEMIGGAKVKAAIDGLIDDAMTKIGQGMPGDQVIKNIRQMRNEAQDIYKAKRAGAALSPEETALADTKMGVANALESLIEANIQDPKALDDFRKARVGMAKTYAYEAATDLNTGKVDPMAIAKMTAGDNSLTGTIADIGKIAGNFPEIAKNGTTADRYLPALSRSGIGGSAGYAVGSLFGAPLTGSIAGAALGGLMSAGGAKGMAGQAYQLAHAVPTDYRPPVNMLRPANINYGPNQLVPYDYAQATTEAPNFVLRPNEYPTKATFVGPQSTPQIGVGGTMETLANESARAAQMSRTLGAQAEQRGEVVYYRTKSGQMTTTPPNEPADMYTRVFRGTGGPEGKDIFELQPKGPYVPPKRDRQRAYVLNEQNVLVPGETASQSQALRQPTSLETAVQKLSGTMVAETKNGVLQPATRQPQAFALTAEERISWNKARANLAEVLPEMAKLSDKDILSRMADRKLAQETVDKARQKAQMFDDLAKRMESEQARRDAAIKRDQMLDLADILEENMRAPRPVSSGGQGPKTREFRRNQLAQDRELKNMLLKD